MLQMFPKWIQPQFRTTLRPEPLPRNNIYLLFPLRYDDIFLAVFVFFLANAAGHKTAGATLRVARWKWELNTGVWKTQQGEQWLEEN